MAHDRRRRLARLVAQRPAECEGAATRDRRGVAVVSVRSTRSLGPAAATGIRATIAGLRRPLRSNTGSAMGAIVVITMAAVASAALVASYDRVVREPTRFGASWDAVVGNNGSLAEAEQVAAALSDVHGVGGAAGILDFSGSFVGREEVPLISFLSVRGQAHTLGPVIVEGRAPTHAGEVALARSPCVGWGCRSVIGSRSACRRRRWDRCMRASSGAPS